MRFVVLRLRSGWRWTDLSVFWISFSVLCFTDSYLCTGFSLLRDFVRNLRISVAYSRLCSNEVWMILDLRSQASNKLCFILACLWTTCIILRMISIYLWMNRNYLCKGLNMRWMGWFLVFYINYLKSKSLREHTIVEPTCFKNFILYFCKNVQ